MKVNQGDLNFMHGHPKVSMSMQKLVPEQYWTFLVYAKRKKKDHSNMRPIVHDSVLILFRTEKNSNFTYGRVLMSKYNENNYWNQESQTRTMVKRLIRRRTRAEELLVHWTKM